MTSHENLIAWASKLCKDSTHRLRKLKNQDALDMIVTKLLLLGCEYKHSIEFPEIDARHLCIYKNSSILWRDGRKGSWNIDFGQLQKLQDDLS